MTEVIKGYEIKKSIIFGNNRGFAIGENPDAVNPFVSWRFKDEDGARSYYWGRYFNTLEEATEHYNNRVYEYREEYGLSEKGAIPKKSGLSDFEDVVEAAICEEIDTEFAEEQKIKKLLFIGVDDFYRPVYQDEKGKYWKDVNCGSGEPYLHDSTNNDFEGEPGWPIKEDFEIVKNISKPKKSISEQIKEGAAQAQKDNAARPAPGKPTEKDRG